MKIGELSRKAGCPVETIRYYEKEGLLQAPLRDLENNYRHYDSNHLERLLFIRRCRVLGMTHEEIRAMMQAINTHGKGNCPVDAIITEHLAHVQQRISELLILEKQLKQLSDTCSSGLNDECGIFKKLTVPEENSVQLVVAPKEHLGGMH